LALCEDLAIPVREQMIPREMLYIADEVFFTGTAAEITPLRSIDRIQVGAGKRGAITGRLQDEFFALLAGANFHAQQTQQARRGISRDVRAGVFKRRCDLRRPVSEERQSGKPGAAR